MAGYDAVNPSIAMYNSSMATNLTSAIEVMKGFDYVGVQFIYTGTPTGSFFVDISMDESNWTELPISPTPAATGAAGNQFVEIGIKSAAFLRARYVRTSGTGSLTIYVSQRKA